MNKKNAIRIQDYNPLKNNNDYAFCEFAYQEVKVCRVGVLNPIVDTWYYLLVRSNCFYKLKIKGPDYKCLQRYGKIKEDQSEYLVILLIVPFIFNIYFCIYKPLPLTEPCKSSCLVLPRAKI